MDDASDSDLQRRRRTVIVPLVVALVFFMENYDSVAIVTVLPQVATTFGITVPSASIGVTAYIVSLAIFTPISGWLVDRLGVRLVFRASIMLFALACTVVMLSETMIQLACARAVQGIGGSMMVPVGRIVILRVTRKEEFVRAMALVTTPAILGSIVAPVVGGFLATYVSWRLAFAINLPLAIITIVAVGRYLDDGPRPAPRRFDMPGFVLTGLALGTGTLLLARFADRPELDLVSSVWLVVAVFLTLAAVQHNRKRDGAMLDFALFRHRTFSSSMLAGSLFILAAAALPFLLPMLFQVGFGMSAFSAGLLTAVWALAALALKASAPFFLRHFGFRNVLVGNCVLLVLAAVSCAAFDAATPVAVMAVTLFAFGAARSLQLSVLNSLAYADIDPSEINGAAVLSSLGRQMCNSLGVAGAAMALGLLAGGLQPDATDISITFLLTALLPLMAGLSFLRLPRSTGQALSGHVARTSP